MTFFRHCLLVICLLTGLAACAGGEPVVQLPTPSQTFTPPATAPATVLSPPSTSTLAATPLTTATPVPNATPTVTPSPTLTPTPDPYAGLTIADLTGRTYGAGQIQVEETLDVTEAFTRSLISYPSEGLTLYGFMNTPQGEGPFPVALVMHGYVAPESYNTIAYTTRYADALAR